MNTTTFAVLQVQYNQGLVKTFVSPSSTPVGVLLAALRAFGRFKSVRVQADLPDETTARFLVQSGNATMVEARQ